MEESVIVNYDDVSYELKLEEPKNELSVVEDKHELKIESPAENKLELLGNLVRLNNNSTHAECIFINDVTISFTTGHNYVLLDLSEYINSDVLYYPVVMLQDFVATHIASRCIFNNSSKKLRLFCDDVTTGQGEAGNTIILIPTISDAIQIEGITNGQYNGDYDRYYTKSEIDSALEGKQDKLTFDTTPTENSTNPVTSGGLYTKFGTKQDTLTFDNTPTENSNNPVKSGGVYSALGGKAGLSSNNDFTGTNTFVAPTLGDDSGKPVTTEWFNDKIQVVNALPATPDENVIYLIPEA